MIIVLLLQVRNQKGEGYRFHGPGGWQWSSATRKCKRNDSRETSNKANQFRIVNTVHGKSQNDKINYLMV
jgi:hypothetical protein